MRAVGYFPGGEGEAEQQLRQYCQAHGYEAGAVITEPGQQGFQALLALARGGVAVVPSVAALGNDAAEACLRYFQLLSAGVAVESMACGGDAARELLELASPGPMAEQVRRAMARLAVRGEALGRPPFGYRVGERRRLEVVPEEAEVVRLIFRLYAQDGLGLRRLAQHLNEMGIRTRTGRLWTVAAVRDILRNRVYLGTYRRFGVRVPANHPALVSAQEFERAQRRLGGDGGGQRRPRVALFPLSGLAYCGYCGGRMVGVRRVQRWRRRSGDIQRREYRYYQCGSRVNRSLCDYHTWRARELEERVVQAALAARGHAPPPPAPDEAALRQLRRRLLRLLAEAARGQMGEDEWRQAGLELVARYLGVPPAEAREALARWRELPLEELGRHLQSVVGRVTVYDDRVEVALRY